MKAKQKSLHCSSAISKKTNMVKDWTKLIVAITTLIKTIGKGYDVVKSIFDHVKPWLKLIWELVFS